MLGAGRLTRSRLAARALFGGVFLPLEPGDRYFDATTLALVRGALRRIPRGARVLDVGTGRSAVLALWLWRERGCRVTATDVDESAVVRARETVRANGAPIEVVRARFLDGVDGEFEHVVVNPPYVPTARGEARALPERLRSSWDGGEEGTAAISGFCASFAAREGRAVAHLGVNTRRHVPRPLVEQRIAAHPELHLARVLTDRVLGVDVFVLERRGARVQSAPS